ncbi:hypothetical protein SAMN05660337_3078 [Maridesulfovibrio ferrireducens]|uniref:Uncharacterized protein n=1 Tax=Maridesulfovibrio ferrireducens TaxID=246191 RepID=A0A1G9KH95_9BACT|nr:hypothetical protein [Maridesulfovibrio ferrireducens]SDL48952.1 hypothetical protein SAMN05660337_3078 [Maridesulfovibrio ferrireducens]
MKKLLLILLALMTFISCTAAAGYDTPFETGGKIYKVALLPWRADTMDFTMKHRWTMTQALKKACKQSGAFVFSNSAYSVNGGNIPVLENVDNQKLWVRKKYGKYEPNIDEVLKVLGNTDADFALLYVISADNGGTVDQGSSYSRSDYIRAFLINRKSKQMIVEFIKTDFLRGQAFADAKKINLLAFSKWLSEKK